MGRMLQEYFSAYTDKLEELDEVFDEKSTIDGKTYHFIAFALAVRSRNACAAKVHFKAALEAGATVKDLNCIVAMVMRDSAAADERWANDTLADWPEFIREGTSCCCCRR